MKFLRALFRRETAAQLSNPFTRGEPMTVSMTGLLGLYSSTEAAMQISALSACVRLISGNVAKLPCQIFRMRGENRAREREHRVDYLMNKRPNSWQTANEFRKMLTAHVALHGNGFALKRMVGAEIDELIPWHPLRVRVRQKDPFEPPTYELQVPGGAFKPYPATDILHLRDLTLDGVLGLSRIEQLRQGLLLSGAAETYATARFVNGAEPGLTLETDKMIGDAQAKRLLEDWNRAHQGPAKMGLPAILEGGLKIHQYTSTNRDTQFNEIRTFQVEDIARAYGVPPHLIGLTEKQTSWGTGVEQMAIGFLEFNLTDWLVMWETAIQRDLLVGPRDENVFAEHLVDALQRADIKTRTDALGSLVQNGIMSRNEARRKMNLPPYPAGEKFLYPSNMTVEGESSKDDSLRLVSAFPSDDPRVAWRKTILSARRAIASRKAS